MNRYVYDSYAMIAFFKDEPGGAEVEGFLSSALNSNFITTVDVGEIFYIEAKRSDLLTAEEMIEDLYKTPLQFVDVSFALVMEAAQIKARSELAKTMGLGQKRRKTTRKRAAA